ncbi:MAG: hypothetical protein V4750_02765 [Pseudomonadota bacterium]
MGGVVVPGQREKKDPLDTVMKGLQIASSVYGIKSDMAKLDAHAEAQKEARAKAGDVKTEKAFVDKGGKTATVYDEMLTKGWTKTAPGVAGSERAFIKTPDGTEEEIGLRPPTKAAAPARTRAITTRNPDGSEKTQIVADEVGSTFNSAPKPKAEGDGEAAAFKKLPPDKQITVRSLATDNAKRVSVANMMREELANFRNAKTEAEKVKAGEGMLKLLNSPTNPDAVGSEEAERIGGFLKFKKGNLLEAGSFIGRDLDLFDAQVEDKLGAMDRSMAENQKIVDQLMGRAAPVQQPEAPLTDKAPPAFKGRREQSPVDKKWYIETAPDQWVPEPTVPPKGSTPNANFIGNRKTILGG